MDDHEAIVQEYLKIALPRCSRTPGFYRDMYGNILPLEFLGLNLKSAMKRLAGHVETFIDPEEHNRMLQASHGDRDLYESIMTSGFVDCVNMLMLVRGHTFEDAVAEATEIVREAVRRYYDGTIEEWAGSLYTEEEGKQLYDVLKRHYDSLEGRDSGQDQGRDLPGGGSER